MDAKQARTALTNLLAEQGKEITTASLMMQAHATIRWLESSRVTPAVAEQIAAYDELIAELAAEVAS